MVLLVSGVLFLIADRHVSLRQLYQIAELGKPPGEPTRSPTYIRFLPAPEQPRIEGEKLDVRDEVMAQIYDRGDPVPKRTLTFNIEVTDEGVTRGLPVYERRTFKNWRKIGRIVYDRACRPITAILSSNSSIRRGARIKTILQPARAWTGRR